MLETQHTGTKADVIDALRQKADGHDGASRSMGTARKPDPTEAGKAAGLREAIELLEHTVITDAAAASNGHSPQQPAWAGGGE